MKTCSFCALLLAISFAPLHAAAGDTAAAPKINDTTSLSLTLPNGLRALVKGSMRSAPYSEVLLVVRAGLTASAPEEQIARVAAAALTAGRRSPSDPPIRLELARLGVTTDCTVGREVVVYRFAVPTVNTLRFLHLLGLLISRETIPVEQWADAIDRDNRAQAVEQADMWLVSNAQLRDLIWTTEADQPRLMQRISTRTADRKQLNDFWQRAYAPENIVLSVWGDLDANQLAQSLRQEFSARPRGPGLAGAAQSTAPALRQRGATHCEQVGEAVPAALLVGVGAVIRNDDAFYASQIAVHILGASYNSRLQRRLRENSGVVYTVEAAAVPVGATGTILRVACQTDQVETTRAIILAELQRLVREPVGPDELEYAKAILLSRLKLDAGSMREEFYRESLQILLNRQMRDPAKAEPIIASFTPQTLLRTLRSTIRNDTVSTLVLSAHPEPVCEVAHETP